MSHPITDSSLRKILLAAPLAITTTSPVTDLHLSLSPSILTLSTLDGVYS